MVLKQEQMICFSLGAAMRRVSKRYSASLTDFNITPPQLFLLASLGQENGQKARTLAEQNCLDASSMTSLLDRTEKLGWVRREADPKDRRALSVFLTHEGQKKLTELEPVITKVQAEIHAEMFADYSAEEVALFMKMLQQVRETIQ